jgi:hypothetical protein
MKYKRNLMAGMIALSFMATGPAVFAAEDPVPPSKVGQYENQVSMRSYTKGTVDTSQKIHNKKHKRNFRYPNK